MEIQASKSPHPLVWVAAIALIVFAGAGTAALMGWLPSSASKSAETPVAKLEQPRSAPAKVAAVHEPAKVVHDKVIMAPVAPAPVAIARCAECGVVQSVHEVDTKGEGSGLGAVGGAVAGGVLGNQFGGGDGKKIMTVVGAVGGAVAGNEIEKRVKTSKSYEITVRFDDGSSRVISSTTAVTWRAGDKVKVINGVIQSNA